MQKKLSLSLGKGTGSRCQKGRVPDCPGRRLQIYFHTFFKSHIGMFYRHSVKQRRICRGDDYDQRQLIYLANLDYLVSDDSGLKELAEYVFGNTRKVITFGELVELGQGGKYSLTLL